MKETLFENRVSADVTTLRILRWNHFSMQEYWSGLPFPSPQDLPDQGIEPRSPALQADALTSEPPGKWELTEFWPEKAVCFNRGIVGCCCSVAPCDSMDWSTPGSCPPLSPGVCSNSCPLSQWCYLTILSSASLFSFCLVFPIIRVFSKELTVCIRWPKYWNFNFTSGLLTNIQGWFPC